MIVELSNLEDVFPDHSFSKLIAKSVNGDVLSIFSKMAIDTRFEIVDSTPPGTSIFDEYSINGKVTHNGVDCFIRLSVGEFQSPTGSYERYGVLLPEVDIYVTLPNSDPTKFSQRISIFSMRKFRDRVVIDEVDSIEKLVRGDRFTRFNLNLYKGSPLILGRQYQTDSNTRKYHQNKIMYTKYEDFDQSHSHVIVTHKNDEPNKLSPPTMSIKTHTLLSMMASGSVPYVETAYGVLPILEVDLMDPKPWYNDLYFKDMYMTAVSPSNTGVSYTYDDIHLDAILRAFNEPQTGVRSVTLQYISDVLIKNKDILEALEFQLSTRDVGWLELLNEI